MRKQLTINHPSLGVCEVLAVHAAGTIDVQASSGRCYRITGLDATLWKRIASAQGVDHA